MKCIDCKRSVRVINHQGKKIHGECRFCGVPLCEICRLTTDSTCHECAADFVVLTNRQERRRKEVEGK